MKEDYENPAWLRTAVTADEQGIIRWLDSGMVPTKAILQRLGLTQEELSRHEAALDLDLDSYATKYQSQQDALSPEEIEEEKAEARAAHGPGVELVNIFTGERFIT
jgi:hypothetical protein